MHKFFGAARRKLGLRRALLGLMSLNTSELRDSLLVLVKASHFERLAQAISVLVTYQLLLVAVLPLAEKTAFALVASEVERVGLEVVRPHFRGFDTAVALRRRN